MFDLIIKGGWLMIPIILCSIFALAIILEKLWGLRRKKILPPILINKIKELLKSKNINEAKNLCTENKSTFSKIILTLLNNITGSKDTIIKNLEDTGKKEAANLEKNIGILNAIAGVAPLLGLLGTVFGMIEVFAKIELEGSSNIKFLSGGIYAALITTAAGLAIAIPTFIMAKYFESKVDRMVSSMEETAVEIMDTIKPEDK